MAAGRASAAQAPRQLYPPPHSQFSSSCPHRLPSPSSSTALGTTRLGHAAQHQCPQLPDGLAGDGSRETPPPSPSSERLALPVPQFTHTPQVEPEP
jgi:hypothetical protein